MQTASEHFIKVAKQLYSNNNNKNCLYISNNLMTILALNTQVIFSLSLLAIIIFDRCCFCRSNFGRYLTIFIMTPFNCMQCVIYPIYWQMGLTIRYRRCLLYSADSRHTSLHNVTFYAQFSPPYMTTLN